MPIQDYIKMYNSISKMLYDYRKLAMDITVYCGLQSSKENLENVIRNLAAKGNVGICWGSYGVSIDERLA